MTTWLPRGFAFLVLVLPFIPIAAAPDDTEITRLIQQLGSDKFKEREVASKRLAEIGEPALDALHQATTSDDPEVRRRAENSIDAIETKLYGEQLRFTGHTAEVWCVCVSADGKRVLTSSADKTLRLWDADTGKCLRVFEGHTDRIVGAALSPDGKRVLSGSRDRTVRLWDATTGKELRQLTGHADDVDCVAFGPEGLALSGSVDQTMRLWDLNTGKQAVVCTGHTNIVRTVAYSGKAKLAATCGNDSSIRLWDLEIGKEVRQLTGHTGVVVSICFSSDGKRLLSAGGFVVRVGEGTLRIWDVETGKELKRIDDANDYCVAFSPDGKRIVSGYSYRDATVHLWEVETGKELRTYEGHTGVGTGVAFFPDGKRIASASEDGTARIWRAPK